jgi:hypothetical protein
MWFALVLGLANVVSQSYLKNILRNCEFPHFRGRVMWMWFATFLLGLTNGVSEFLNLIYTLLIPIVKQ